MPDYEWLTQMITFFADWQERMLSIQIREVLEKCRR